MFEIRHAIHTALSTLTMACDEVTGRSDDIVIIVDLLGDVVTVDVVVLLTYANEDHSKQN